MRPRIRICALEHFSDQDLTALEAAGGDRFAWRRVPYWRFRDPANRLFPAAVRSGLETFASVELTAARERFADWSRTELDRLYREWPFDVLLLPSDIFYYVRALPPLCHELGIPVIVAQKETTITERFMRAHTSDVAANAPFVSDRMTVCSERHKEFWVRSGANPALIDVTGQPRFDFYATPDRCSWSELGLEQHERTVLFLSYEPDAYLLDEQADWLALRNETEEALADAAASADLRVVVKLHPLQDLEAESLALDRFDGYGRSIVMVSPATDTRVLLTLADAVVGFQSTALLEAMVLGKPTAYAGWGELHEANVGDLIPYARRPELLHVARDGADLRTWLLEPPSPPPPASQAARQAFVEEYLGPFDGRASERTLAVVEGLYEQWAPGRRESSRRAALERRRRVSAPLTAARDRVLLAAWDAAKLVARTVPGRLGDRVAARAAFAAGPPRERLAAARSAKLG